MALAKKILVPVDFAAPSSRACDRAMALATDLRAEVVLMHAIDPHEHPLLPDGLAHLHEIAERTMRSLAKKLRPARTLIVTGVPWEAILTAIGTEQADLVVCGTHNRRGLAHLALGSVAERIVRMSPVPVLTIPGFAFESREDAGARLARDLSIEELPRATTVVAVGIDAVTVANVVARTLGAPLDLWHSTTITMNGRVVGALGEDELAYYDEPHCDPSFARVEAEARARETLREEVSLVRGMRGFGDVLDRFVLLVVDTLAAPAKVRSVADAVRLLGAKGIALAVPVASAVAVAECTQIVDRVVCLEETMTARPIDIAYRNAVPTSNRKIRRLLGEWRAHSAA